MVKFCPNGDGAFEDWVERCPECGRRLESEPLPSLTTSDRDPTVPEEAPGDDPVVYLATLPNEPLAQLAVDVLRDAGIKSMLRPNGPGFGAWASVAAFAHDLYVLQSDHAEAAEILASLNEADDEPFE